MGDKVKPDWDPRSEEVLRDQRMAYDRMRERCPVAYSEFLGWSLFRHEDVTRVLQERETFSNSVSRHRSVPNGMDPPEHTTYRRIIEPYFAPERMEAFEPVCRKIVSTLVQNTLASDEVELIADFAQPFAVRVQCAFLGWPAALHEPLIHWTIKSHEATLAQDRQSMSQLAREFEGFIDGMLEARLQTGAKPEDDVTAALMHERVEGRPLKREEIASILRNWTAGEIDTISAAVGILVHYLARQAGLQMQLRAEPSLLPAAIDEILRIHGPLVANRRITTRPVEIGGRKIDTGERISLNWISANRDGRVFEAPDAFRLDRDPAKNLLYGLGIHACPGAPLARLELQVAMEELLRRTTAIELAPDKSPTNATYPASGVSALPLKIQRAL
ncbi:MAG: cytochrome [Actinobacteria bacterium RBG_13_63_9]|nr:MAG: cytochrome [Actinobacteria bacterium RBG_13_63_9]